MSQKEEATNRSPSKWPIIDALLLIHSNTFNYLSNWPVVVWKYETIDNEWTHKKMRWHGMSTRVETRINGGTSLMSLWVSCISANGHLEFYSTVQMVSKRLVIKHSMSGLTLLENFPSNRNQRTTHTPQRHWSLLIPCHNVSSTIQETTNWRSEDTKLGDTVTEQMWMVNRMVDGESEGEWRRAMHPEMRWQ
jgi:hypothetical protein